MRLNSIHLPLGRVDVPLSQAGKYSLFMLCCWPRFLRMTGSVPRKLLSVAEYSSLSAERQICTLESNSAFQPPARSQWEVSGSATRGKEKTPQKKEVWEKVREMCARRLSGAFACKVELDSGTLCAILWIRSRWRTRGEQFLFCASTTSEKINPPQKCSILSFWQKQTEAAFCWVRIPDVWPLNPANSSRK